VEKQLKIGPVDSGNAAFDSALRDRLRASGFVSVDERGIDWVKNFKDELTREAAAESVFADIGRIAVDKSLSLPKVLAI
jgi:hypothetical protein